MQVVLSVSIYTMQEQYTEAGSTHERVDEVLAAIWRLRQKDVHDSLTVSHEVTYLLAGL